MWSLVCCSDPSAKRACKIGAQQSLEGYVIHLHCSNVPRVRRLESLLTVSLPALYCRLCAGGEGRSNSQRRCGAVGAA
jgi:hypothetical protein